MQDAVGAVNSMQRGRCEVVHGKIVAAKEA
jgi:hypothetical protein